MSFLNNESTDLKSNTEELPIPSVPKHRPIRKAYTADATLGMSLSKPQTVSKNITEGAFDNNVEVPPVPSHRFVKRTTTDEINSLIRNTNEELEQMEKLVTKHTHSRHFHTSKRQDTTPDSSPSDSSSDTVSNSNEKSEPPVVPQRPHSNKSSLLSYSRHDSQLQHGDETKTLETTEAIGLIPLETSIADMKLNNSDKDKRDTELPQVPLRRPIKRQSSLEANKLSVTNPFSDSNKNFNTTKLPTTEHNSTSSNLPDVKELRTTGKIEQDLQSLGFKDKQIINEIDPLVIKTNPKIEKELGSKVSDDNKEEEEAFDTNDNIVVGNEPVEIRKTEDEADNSENSNSKINEAVEDVKNSADQIEPSNNGEHDDSFLQNISHDNDNLESSNIEEEKKTVEDIKKDKTRIEPLINPTISNLTSTTKKGDKNHDSIETKQDISTNFDLKYNLQDTTKIKDNHESLLEKEKTLTTDKSAKTEECNMDSTVNINKNSFSNKTSTDTNTSKAIPQIPLSRPQKRGPPPVPKKPSSKIAAFHEMLQKQQMKDLETQDVKIIKNKETDKRLPTNINFIGDLNNLIALPGMTPQNTNTISKVNNDDKVQDSNTVIANGQSEINESTHKKELHDLRQRRSRGPRGRKLPSNMNNMTKVVVKNENYVIKVRHLWSLKCIANNFTTQIPENSSLVETEKEKLNDQQNDVLDTESQRGTMEHSTEDNIAVTVTNDTEPEKFLNSATSLTDSILSRNDYNDDVVLRKEKDFETTTEKEMQKQLMERDEMFVDCVSDADFADSRASTVSSLEPVSTNSIEEDNVSLNST